MESSPSSTNDNAYLKIKSAKIALLHAKILDGTGRPALSDQTLLIENERILAVGPSASLIIPEDFESMDASGKTVVPGLIGTHNHLRLPQGAMLYHG